MGLQQQTQWFLWMEVVSIMVVKVYILYINNNNKGKVQFLQPGPYF